MNFSLEFNKFDENNFSGSCFWIQELFGQFILNIKIYFCENLLWVSRSYDETGVVRIGGFNNSWAIWIYSTDILIISLTSSDDHVPIIINWPNLIPILKNLKNSKSKSLEHQHFWDTRIRFWLEIGFSRLELKRVYQNSK